MCFHSTHSKAQAEKIKRKSVLKYLSSAITGELWSNVPKPWHYEQIKTNNKYIPTYRILWRAPFNVSNRWIANTFTARARSPYPAYRRRWKLTSKIQFKLVPRLSCQRARIIQISNPANGRTVTRKVNSASFQRSNQKSFVNSIAYSHRINLLLLLLWIASRYRNYSLLVAEQNTYAITNTARTDLIALEILTAFYAR